MYLHSTRNATSSSHPGVHEEGSQAGLTGSDGVAGNGVGGVSAIVGLMTVGIFTAGIWYDCVAVFTNTPPL
jgi:hypothetical protein